jgi:hypothetical protein
MEDGNVAAWGADWAWGLPLIVSNVVFHVFGVGLINQHVARRLGGFSLSRYLAFRSAFVIGGTALAVIVLRGSVSGARAAATFLAGGIEHHLIVPPELPKERSRNREIHRSTCQ